MTWFVINLLCNCIEEKLLCHKKCIFLIEETNVLSLKLSPFHYLYIKDKWSGSEKFLVYIYLEVKLCHNKRFLVFIFSFDSHWKVTWDHHVLLCYIDHNDSSQEKNLLYYFGMQIETTSLWKLFLYYIYYGREMNFYKNIPIQILCYKPFF